MKYILKQVKFGQFNFGNPNRKTSFKTLCNLLSFKIMNLDIFLMLSLALFFSNRRNITSIYMKLEN